MDATLIGGMAGVLGSLVGGSATVATAWLTQKTANKRELVKRSTASAKRCTANSSPNAASFSSTR